ncbi:glutamate receptor ionotropic, delta-1-like [Palaemon carinicauda]|uniref:glutamate receptor ionotropic, delta-1-like n=1 Tax=Palaemon carinicauda TaxID=392227 RepID=UPI0035B602AA
MFAAKEMQVLQKEQQHTVGDQMSSVEEKGCDKVVNSRFWMQEPDWYGCGFKECQRGGSLTRQVSALQLFTGGSGDGRRKEMSIQKCRGSLPMNMMLCTNNHLLLHEKTLPCLLGLGKLPDQPLDWTQVEMILEPHCGHPKASDSGQPFPNEEFKTRIAEDNVGEALDHNSNFPTQRLMVNVQSEKKEDCQTLPQVPRVSYLRHVDSRANDASHTDTANEIVRFVYAASPPHLLYLIYDDTFKDMNTILKMLSSRGPELTVMRYTPDIDSLHAILSSELTIVNTQRRQIILLCSLENIVKIFEMVAARNWERRSLWWIVVAMTSGMTNVLQGFLREGSQVTVFQKTSSNLFHLYSAIVDTSGDVRFQDIGTWEKNAVGYKTHLTKDLFIDLEKSYSDFAGRELTVTANENYPFIRLEQESHGEMKLVEGFEYTIINSLGKALNFSSQLMGKWGGPLPNGTVIGLIGDIARREAHFSLCEIRLLVILSTGLREEVIDFTYPHYIETVTLVSRTPRQRVSELAAFSPFTPTSWICIILSLLAMGPILAVESLIMKSYREEEHVGYGISSSSFNAFRVLMKQEDMFTTKHWPLRFTSLFWYFFCFILAALYSSMLTATLVKPSFEKPINGLTDLPAASKDGFTLVVTGDSIFEYMFKDAKEGVYASTYKLFNHKDRTKSFVKSIIPAFDTLLEDKLVLISGELNLKYQATKKGRSQYYFARDTFAPQYYGAPCVSGAPFLYNFNKMISYMTEGGLKAKWVDNEFQKVAGKGIIINNSGPKAFTVTHLQAAFYIILIGFLTASAGLIAEHISKRCLDIA